MAESSFELSSLHVGDLAGEEVEEIQVSLRSEYENL